MYPENWVLLEKCTKIKNQGKKVSSESKIGLQCRMVSSFLMPDLPCVSFGWTRAGSLSLLALR